MRSPRRPLALCKDDGEEVVVVEAVRSPTTWRGGV
jgi:hypothetical protein